MYESIVLIERYTDISLISLIITGAVSVFCLVIPARKSTPVYDEQLIEQQT